MSAAHSSPAEGLVPGDDLTQYKAAVDDALLAGRDVWGEDLLRLPDGPTYAALADHLTPILHCDRTYQTETGIHYLVLTDRVGAESFALHVADGSQVIAEYTNLWGAPEWALPFPVPPRGGTHVLVHDLLVGASTDELFGTHRAEHVQPRLADGWLPILRNGYVDADGARWARESFVSGGPEGLVSLVSLTLVDGAGARTVAVRSRGEHTTTEWFDLRPGERLTLRIANSEGPGSVRTVDAAAYDAARERYVAYWTQVLAEGADLQVPEPLVMDAWRNVITQNLVLGERYSIGNPYETTFLMEAHGACLALLRWGFTTRAAESLDRLADMTNGAGPEWYESWERGVKMAAAADLARLTRSTALLDKHLPAYLSYLDDFAAQRAGDPHGLLAPERYAWDIPEVVYGWHSQACAWRGAHDLLGALETAGRDEATPARRAEIDALGAALRQAAADSTTTLPDGSAFVPVSLFSDEQPYEHLTESRLANYWNLVAPYALASGVVPPGSELARGLHEYMARHGAWLLGLTRFNGLYDPPTPIGTWREDGTAGYCAPGIDNAFGVQTLFFLADNADAERLVLALYAKLAHGMTRHTFVDGEATTIGVRADEFHRSTWYPPNGTSNSLYLEALRLLLVREVRDEHWTPASLELGWALPRPWLVEGDGVAVRRLPTSFGPVSYALTPQLSEARLRVTADVPAPARLHVRLPAAWRVDPACDVAGWDTATSTLAVPPGRPLNVELPLLRVGTP